MGHDHGCATVLCGGRRNPLCAQYAIVPTNQTDLAWSKHAMVFYAIEDGS
jgi:hypothetical protein